MEKKFRLVLDFSAEINDALKRIETRKGRCINILLKEFLKEDKAILDLYKLWLLGDLKFDEHYDRIEADIHTRDEIEILEPILNRLPQKTGEYFREILHADDLKFEELKLFFEQFGLLNFIGATFSEVM